MTTPLLFDECYQALAVSNKLRGAVEVLIENNVLQNFEIAITACDRLEGIANYVSYLEQKIEKLEKENVSNL